MCFFIPPASCFRGNFLDAGTGTHSLKWINTLDTEGFTAVTADPQFAETTRKEVRTHYDSSTERGTTVPSTQTRTTEIDQVLTRTTKRIIMAAAAGGGGVGQREPGHSSMGLTCSSLERLVAVAYQTPPSPVSGDKGVPRVSCPLLCLLELPIVLGVVEIATRFASPGVATAMTLAHVDTRCPADIMRQELGVK